MRPVEAEWIFAELMARGVENVSPVANVGSSTLEFRTKKKPHIEERLFRPLREAGCKIVNIDLRKDEGVDLVGDLTDPAFVASLKQMGFKSVICANVLEHLADRGPLVSALSDIVSVGGVLVVTVPYSYPYHPDPIDTLYRPSPGDLAGAFSKLKIVKGDVLSDGTWREEVFSGGAASGLARLLASVARAVNVARPKIAYGQLHRWLWLFRSYKISCVSLEKRAAAA
jgi:SAM-dependent methyltransferase